MSLIGRRSRTSLHLSKQAVHSEDTIREKQTDTANERLHSLSNVVLNLRMSESDPTRMRNLKERILLFKYAQ